jgi:hypothetical protein
MLPAPARARRSTSARTETIVEALKELERQKRRATLRGLKGKIRFSLDRDFSPLQRVGIPLLLA